MLCPCLTLSTHRGLLYCMEYLEDNLDEWLGEELEVRKCMSNIAVGFLLLLFECSMCQPFLTAHYPECWLIMSCALPLAAPA